LLHIAALRYKYFPFSRSFFIPRKMMPFLDDDTCRVVLCNIFLSLCFSTNSNYFLRNRALVMLISLNLSSRFPVPPVNSLHKIRHRFLPRGFVDTVG